MKLKKLTALCMAMLMTVSVTACGGSKPASSADGSAAAAETKAAEKQEVSAEKKDKIVYALSADGGTLGPLKAPKGKYGDTTINIYDNLFWYTVDGEFVPRACTGYEQVDDTHYRLTLRDDVKFSDGHLLVAEDVKYTLQMYAQDANSKTWVKYINPDDIVVEDDTHLVFGLTQPYAFQIYNVGNVNLFYKEAYEASSDGMAMNPIGSGPYTVKEYVPGTYVDLVARDDYWGEKGTVPNVRIMFMGEASQMTTALKTGELDIAVGVLASDYEGLLADGMKGLMLKNEKIRNLRFNCSEASICNDPKVRQAIAYATHNEGMLNAAYGGYGEVCTTCGSDYSTDVGDFYYPEDYYGYDLEKAKALIAEAGIKEGTPVTIQVKSSEAGDKMAAQILQESLSEIGLAATIKQVDAAVADANEKDANSGWDVSMATINTTASGCLMDIMNLYLNMIENLHYDDPTAKELATAGVASTEAEAYHKNMQDLMKIMCEDLPYYAICTCNELVAYNSALKDVTPSKRITIVAQKLQWEE